MNPHTRTIMFGVIAAICYVAASVIEVLCVAVLLAILLDPGVELLRKLRLPRSVGAFIMVLVLLGSIYLAFALLYNRTDDFVQQIPRYSEVIRNHVLSFQHGVEQLQKKTEQIIPPVKQPPRTVTVVQTPQLSSYFFPGVAAVSKVALMAGFVPILIFFMLTWKEHFRSTFILLFEVRQQGSTAKSLVAIAGMLRWYLLGNFLLGALLTVLSLALFLSLRLPSAFILALLSGFLTLIPYLGLPLAIIPPLVVSFGEFHSSTPYVVLLGVLTALHLIGTNAILPKMVGSMLDVNPLALTVAMLVWGWLWGPIGLVLAIPITAAIKAICDNTPSLKDYGRLLGTST